MSSCSLILDSLNQTFDNLSLRRRTHKSQGRKLGTVWWRNTRRKRVKFYHKNSIYSQYFTRNSLCFYLCSPMKHTSSFHRVSSKTSRNMKAKRAETDARRCHVSHFAVVNAQPRLVNDHFTGGGQESFNLENFVAHVYWTFDLRSSLYIINLPHSYKAVWNATVTFFLLPSYRFAY